MSEASAIDVAGLVTDLSCVGMHSEWAWLLRLCHLARVTIENQANLLDAATKIADRTKEDYDDCAAECAALRADAMRYRWLRVRANMDYPVQHGAPGISMNMPTGNNACHYPVQSDLDSSIDAAIAKDAP